MKTLSAGDKIRRAIIQLNKEQPFFGMLSMHLQPTLMPKDHPMQSVGVDAKGRLFYAEEFIDGLDDTKCKGVLCHEVMHVALLHFLRTGNRDRIIANIAQDVVVNSIVLGAGLSLPDGGIPVDVHRDISEFDMGPKHIRITDVSKKTWEEIYGEIYSKLPPGDGQGRKGRRAGGKGFDDHIEGGEDMSPSEKGKVEGDWQGHLADAADYAKKQGNLPAGMERIVDGILKPKVAWKQLLLKYIRPFLSPVDWSYQRPHRKSAILDVYMPNTLKEHCEIEVLVDTSGSIGQEELQEFLSEIVGIAKSMQHVKMWVSFCDTQIGARYEVDNGEIPKIMAMKPTGGGGTSMEAGLDTIKEKNGSIPVVVVLTDGCDTFSKSRKDYPFDVIWVITERGITDYQTRIPYGMKVKMGV